MDINQKAKSNVLQQLIEMMDEKMTGDLKSKSPKFAKVEVAARNPSDLEEDLDKEHSSDVDDEDNKRLLELYSKLK